MDKNIIKGGSFLIDNHSSKNTFIPEDLNEEQKMMRDMCRDFLKSEIYPNLDRIDNLEEGLMASMLEKSGQLGLLAVSMPEQYDGFGKDFTTAILVTEEIGAGHSFAVALSAHTGIGTLPILYFGTEEQKNKYLPKLASGELKASYCLTEPGSGSDALAAKTTAVLTPDKKHYILNGQKMWITNAGFADVFIVFAKIDGEKFTGFIVDKGTEGLSLGNEEKKMGIKGSSTRQVFLSDCKVPAGNLLGEIGEGHKIAFNILNVGRIKLGAAALGASKKVLSDAIKYANERIQFKVPISSFGAIQYKLAEAATRIYASESALYRASDCIHKVEQAMHAEGKPLEEALLGGAYEFAIECAILKVGGSETLDYVADEGVQILGGYGFSADYPMDRAYRDSRINRIFEGTNEINRMLIIDMFMKRAMKGELNLMGAAAEIQKELMGMPDLGTDESGTLVAERKAVENMKKAILLAAGFAVQKYMQKLSEQQEILMYISDMIIDLYQAESALLRTEKLIGIKGDAGAEYQIYLTQVYVNDAVDRVNINGKYALSAMTSGDELKMLLMGLKRYTKFEPLNTTDLRRKIAKKLIAENDFCF